MSEGTSAASTHRLSTAILDMRGVRPADGSLVEHASQTIDDSANWIAPEGARGRMNVVVVATPSVVAAEATRDPVLRRTSSKNVASATTAAATLVHVTTDAAGVVGMRRRAITSASVVSPGQVAGLASVAAFPCSPMPAATVPAATPQKRNREDVGRPAIIVNGPHASMAAMRAHAEAPTAWRAPPRASREFVTATAIACALVIARAFVYVRFEQAFFDSDQAIVGLMAKHLSEGRAFPLFFYGQPYMLAVEAWLAVPVFWIAGPTVTALHASLLITNLAVAVLLVLGLHRWGGLRPYHALLASVFVIFAPPYTAARLIEAQGGNIEPFLYVLLLWMVRARPLVFGALLGFAFLNREFSIYAVPVLMVGELVEGRLFRIETMRSWLLSAVAFLLVWDGLEALQPYADLMGPGTRGELLGGFAGSQVENLARRVAETGSGVPARVWTLVYERLPALLGGRPLIEQVASQGHAWVGWLLAVMGLSAVARVAILVTRRAAPVTGRPASFAWYLLGIGVVALAAHAVTRPAEDGNLRYLLLALLLPVGLTALWLAYRAERFGALGDRWSPVDVGRGLGRRSLAPGRAVFVGS